MDALAHERRRLGLPAMTVNWGFWTGAGMATNEELQASRARFGMETIDPEKNLERFLPGLLTIPRWRN